MPIYEFECKICGNITESLEKIGTKILKCPNCGENAHKIPSRSNFQLLGGGWYKDGYSKPEEK